MKISVRVVANAKQRKVVIEQDVLKVYVTQPAQRGKANKELIEMLSRHFNVPKAHIRILKGEKSNKKIVNVARLAKLRLPKRLAN